MVDADQLTLFQINDQKSSDPTVVHETFVNERMKDVHTGMPGIIQSFDPDSQTASVQPALQRLFTDRGWVPLPPCMNVLCQFPRGGGGVLTFPVGKGDECWLAFSERAIDNWFQSGGVQKPNKVRMHNLSDAVAHLGFSSQPNKLVNFNTTGTELRTIDGTARFVLGNDKSLSMINPEANFSISAAGAAILQAVSYEVKCPMKVDGAVTATGDVVAGNISLQQHTQPVVGSIAEAPTP